MCDGSKRQDLDHVGMLLALEEAYRALEEGEPPVGAVVLRGEALLARGRNARENSGDPTAHAEVLALRRAAEVLGTWRLAGCVLYVTLEPCVMCAGAAILARIERVVFGALDPRGGALGSLYDLSRDPRIAHRFSVRKGVRKEACAALLDRFFREARKRGERSGG